MSTEPSRRQQLSELDRRAAELLLHLGSLAGAGSGPAPRGGQAVPLPILGETVARLGELTGGEVHLTMVGHAFSLGWRPVKVGSAGRASVQQLCRAWCRHGIGRLTFARQVSPSALEILAELLGGGRRVKWRGKALAIRAGEVQIHSLPAGDQTSPDEIGAECPGVLVDALLHHCRRSWRAALAGASLDLRGLRRLLVSVAERLQSGDPRLLGLVCAPGALTVPEAHVVRVTLFAMQAGVALDLPRRELLDLGAGAMLHGLAKIRGARGEEQLCPFSPSGDREGVERFIRTLLSNLCARGGLSPQTLPLLVVLHEAQLEFSRADLYPRIAPGGVSHHLFSQLTALATMASLAACAAAQGGQQPSQELAANLERAAGWIHPDLALTFSRVLSGSPMGHVREILDEAAASAEDGPEAGPIGPAVRSEGRAPRVLLVDDEADIRMTLRALLENFGFEVEEAEDGLWGSRLIKSRPYDLVFLDLMMPQMDGFDLLRSLPAELRERLPIVILSARSQDREVLHGHELGAAHYLVKPFEVATVLETLAQLVQDLGPEQGRRISQFLARK